MPYQETGDEHLMAKNLSKYFRHRFAIRQKPSNAHTLTNVTFKVFKVEKVPSYKGLPDKKTELIQKATNTEDLYGGTFCNFCNITVKPYAFTSLTDS